MPDLPRSKTVYSEYVFSNLSAQLKIGQGAYTVEECAAMVGLKPTRHFKARVRQMARLGRILATPVFTPRGGLSVVYSHIEQIESEVFPF